MAFIIFPTENDVGVATGDGRISTESNMTRWLNNTRPIPTHYFDGTTVGSGGIESGFYFDLAAHSGLTASISSGVATIRGYRCESNAVETIALTASSHNHIYLSLDKISGLVTGASLSNQVTSSRDDKGTPPVDSIYLWDLFTDASTVDFAFDFRNWQTGILTGTYLGDGQAERLIDLGFSPKQVIIQHSASGAGEAGLYSVSPLAYPISETRHYAGRAFVAMHLGTKDASALTLNEAAFAQFDPQGFIITSGIETIPSGEILTADFTETVGSTQSNFGGTTTVTGCNVGDVAFITAYQLPNQVHQQSGGPTSSVAGKYGAYVSDANEVTWLLETVFEQQSGTPIPFRVTVISTAQLYSGVNISGLRYFFQAWA